VTLFVDASVWVAILAGEADAEQWARTVDSAGPVLTSAIVIWEATRGIGRLTRQSQSGAAAELRDYMVEFGVTQVGLGDAEVTAAIYAHETYGKGNHPAKLNMGDCFAYACAKANDARLLYKGDDFAQTDLA
jgi:ribonuclease VapC